MSHNFLAILNILGFLVGFVGAVFGSYKAGVAAGKNGTAQRLEDLENTVKDGFKSMNTRFDAHLESHGKMGG